MINLSDKLARKGCFVSYFKFIAERFLSGAVEARGKQAVK